MPQDNLKLRGVFADISRGFSEGFVNSKPVAIKHLGLQDQIDLDYFYDRSFNIALDRGILPEKERLEKVYTRGFWKLSDDVEIATLRDYISRLQATRSKLSIQSQIDSINNNIKTEVDKLNQKLKDRENYIGQTAEKYAGSKLNEYYIFHSFRKKGKIETKLYKEEEFDNLEDNEISELVLAYNEAIDGINDKNIKLISVQPFFQNYFYLTDSIYEFWGKKIIDLTLFQSEISAYGRYFKSLLQNSEAKIPDEIRNDPEKLVEFCSMNTEAQKSFNATAGELSSHSKVGANQADYDRMGAKTANPESIWARKKLAKTGDGSLNSKEIAELRRDGQIKAYL